MSGGGVAGRGGRCRMTMGGAGGNAGLRTLKNQQILFVIFSIIYLIFSLTSLIIKGPGGGGVGGRKYRTATSCLYVTASFACLRIICGLGSKLIL